jgi:hypothetical protein
MNGEIPARTKDAKSIGAVRTHREHRYWSSADEVYVKRP